MERSPRNTIEGSEKTYCTGSDDGIPQLGERMLHVWTWNLDVGRKCLSEQEELLSAEEWQRIKRFSSHRLARRFIARRGMLRRILGHYLDQPPQAIRFVYNPHGKPFLAPDLFSDLQFNLSDSAELAALAICLGHTVGIDIERVRPVPVLGELASYGLSPRELDHFERASEPELIFKFLLAWTRREAIAKAEGVGLQLLTGQSSLHDLANFMPPDSDAVGNHRKCGLYLHQLALPAGYVGSLATRPNEPRVIYCTPQQL